MVFVIWILLFVNWILKMLLYCMVDLELLVFLLCSNILIKVCLKLGLFFIFNVDDIDVFVLIVEGICL